MKQQAERVREAKGEGGDKAVIDKEVGTLLELKVRLPLALGWS